MPVEDLPLKGANRKKLVMIPDSHIDLLAWETRSFAHLATIGPDGEPQTSPVWFEWDGTHIKFSLTTNRQKYRNLQSDKRAAFSVIDPENAYRYIEIRGELDDIEPDPEIDFISRKAKKYIDKERYPWHQEVDERVVMKVKPTKISGMG
ncbi:MAG TPA: PPOX class F420-dependent oxidoreductase [Acidimicrobiia bacterium]|nr:PPOX class F420-dependent oxidoreductase [Acidimicrobiia bacterium]